MPGRTVDDRGDPCGIAERPPTAAPDTASFASLRRPLITYFPGILMSCVVAIMWILVIDPMIFALVQVKTGVIGATVAALATNITFEIKMMPRFYALRWDGFTRVYLRAGECPACGYGLSGVPETDDGFVLCPECRASWRAGRLGADDDEGAQEPAG